MYMERGRKERRNKKVNKGTECRKKKINSVNISKANNMPAWII
jgi:hypothetical protein